MKPQTLSTLMQQFAESLATECKKLYAPASNDTRKSNAAINVLCLRAIKFKQQHPFGVLGVIKIIKLIRKQLKKLNYDNAFINELTIFLVKTLLKIQSLKTS